MTIRNTAYGQLSQLATFKAIFDCRNIEKAAESVGITQSAASKHLAKLRASFNDELFVRSPQGMQPTPKAYSIIERVVLILGETEALMAESEFNPSSIQGDYVISTTDEIRRRLLPKLLPKIAKLSPLLRLTLIPLEPDYSIRKLETGAVDLVISVNWHAPDQLIQRRLFGDRFVCLMNKQNPLAKKSLSIESYVGASHLMVAPMGMKKGYIDDILLADGHRRFVRLSVPEFSLISSELLGSDHIVTLPHRVALDLAKNSSLTIKNLPFELPHFDYYEFWHRRFRNDTLGAWVRGMIEKVLSD